VFMSPSAEPPKVSPASAPISVMLKRASNRLVLIAVNRGATAVEATLSSADLKPGAAKVLNENREASITAGGLRDKFEPYATHVYELAR